MKSFIFSVIVVMVSSCVTTIKAQNILNDPSIVAQHKRMVYESWGDFRPNPNYVLGVQTNLAYATVWGWLSPSRNQDYKNGPDIRPLKPDGLEVQRLAILEAQRKSTEELKQQVDTVYSRSLQDFAHWTSATVDVDPLWLLYYDRMLKPLRDFPAHPNGATQWGFRNLPEYNLAVASGDLVNLQEQLDILKDKYQQSRTMPMPRGKRFIMYHETLMGWRKFISKLSSYKRKISLLDQYKNYQPESGATQNWSKDFAQTDVEIARSVMETYKHQF